MIEFCGQPVTVTKEQIQEVLPHDETAYDASQQLTHRGEPVCPVPLSIHEDLGDLLSLEADLDGWHANPLAGGVLDWPSDLLAALRHVRGVKGLLQMKRIEREEKQHGHV